MARIAKTEWNHNSWWINCTRKPANDITHNFISTFLFVICTNTSRFGSGTYMSISRMAISQKLKSGKILFTYWYTLVAHKWWRMLSVAPLFSPIRWIVLKGLHIFWLAIPAMLYELHYNEHRHRIHFNILNVEYFKWFTCFFFNMAIFSKMKRNITKKRIIMNPAWRHFIMASSSSSYCILMLSNFDWIYCW